jgi:hypothetical protein
MAISISVADIERAKKLSKQSKSQYPHLSHAKRLDYAAHQLFNARNYHELNKWREATIQKHVVDAGTTATCSYCGLTFAPDIREDQKEHRSRHDAFEEATTCLNYIPEQHQQREIRKKAGYTAMSDGINTQQRMIGALDVLRGWFDRSLESAISSGYWKQHPEFEVYVSYMIGGLDPILFPLDVINGLERKFGRIDGIIEKGHSYWYPSKKTKV